RPAVRAVFYAGEVADPGTQLTSREAHELLGFVAHRARAFLEAYGSAATQVGPMLSVVAFERLPARASLEAALFGAARFAQEIARSALDQGVIVRAAVCVGDGVLFEDVNGLPAVASLASRRADTRRCPPASLAVEDRRCPRRSCPRAPRRCAAGWVEWSAPRPSGHRPAARPLRRAGSGARLRGRR